MLGKLKNNKILTAVAALLCCALWGISTPVVKLGYQYTDPTHVPSLLLWAGIQFAVAGLLVIGIYSLSAKRLMRPTQKSIKGILLVALFQTVLHYAISYIGLSGTTSVKGAILKSTDVFFVALIASVIFKLEKLTAKKLIACAISFSGIVLMNLDGSKLDITLGDGLVVVSILCYSLGAVLSKVFAKDTDPIVLSGYQMTFGGTVMLAAGALFGGKLDLVGMLPVILGLSSIYAFTYALWTYLLKYNSASEVSIYSFMTPVFGVIFSGVLLSENSGVAPLKLALALGLVCFGILLWGYERKVKNSQ